MASTSSNKTALTDYFTIEVTYEMSNGIDVEDDDSCECYFGAVNFDIDVKDLAGNYICGFNISHVTYNEHFKDLKEMRLELGKKQNSITFDEDNGSTEMKTTKNFITFSVYHFSQQNPSSLYSKFPINKEVENMLDRMIEILEDINKQIEGSEEKSDEESDEESEEEKSEKEDSEEESEEASEEESDDEEHQDDKSEKEDSEEEGSDDDKSVKEESNNENISS